MGCRKIQVVECLPIKPETLGSNSSTTKQKKRENNNTQKSYSYMKANVNGSTIVISRITTLSFNAPPTPGAGDGAQDLEC
jgi:hypothetical protein